MSYSDILYRVEAGVATITFNRPDTRNALDETMRHELTAAVEQARGDPAAKVVVITGAGRYFSPGGNPGMAPEGQRGAAWQPSAGAAGPHNELRHLVETLYTFEKPLIASVNGPAAASGMEICSLSDIRIASERAKFVMAHVRIGIVPPLGGAYTLPRLIGVGKALELMWTGRPLDAQEAYRIGYVDMLVPHDDLEAVTQGLARQLARGPALAHRMVKRLVRESASISFQEHLDAVWEAMQQLRESRDVQEGRSAYVERRNPRFKGQ